MPSRMIREGWLESHRIDALDAAAERFFLRLCLKADDYGRFHATPQILKSLLFPMKEDLRSTDMSRFLVDCEKAGLVRCYDHSGKPFVEVLRFDQRMRSKSSKFPAPPDGCPADDGHVTGMCPPEGKGREVEEKGREAEVFSTPPLSRDGVLSGLRDTFPDSPKGMSAGEQRDLEEARPVLVEFTEEDWKASKAWVSATDRARGRKLWPRDRREFIKNAGEAIEMIRKWWKKDGRKLSGKPVLVPVAVSGRAEDHQELSKDQMSALLRGETID